MGVTLQYWRVCFILQFGRVSIIDHLLVHLAVGGGMNGVFRLMGVTLQ